MAEQQAETIPPQSQHQSPGIVYVLTNEAMEGYIKIGQTSGDSPRDVLGRMRELNTTGVPRPFYCEYAVVTERYTQVEQAILRAFAHNRVAGKEFLEGVHPLQIRTILELLALQDLTPSQSENESTADSTDGGTSRRPGFRFPMAKVPLGVRIDWADDTSKKAVVVSSNHVEYDEETLALSKITALSSEGKILMFHTRNNTGSTKAKRCKIGASVSRRRPAASPSPFILSTTKVASPRPGGRPFWCMTA